MEKSTRSARRKQSWIFTIILLLIIVGISIGSSWQTKQRQQLVYTESLDKVAAFYVAYEEAEVEKQAFAYDAEHPKKYWGIRLNKTYVYAAARNAVIQMAIHDEVFYEMAMQEEIELTDDETQTLKARTNEFWQDLVEDGKDVLLGVQEADIAETMRRIAYAEKYQSIYAQMEEASYEDYDFSGDAYSKLLEKQDYSINKNVVKRLGVGSITLQY